LNTQRSYLRTLQGKKEKKCKILPKGGVQTFPSHLRKRREGKEGEESRFSRPQIRNKKNGTPCTQYDVLLEAGQGGKEIKKEAVSIHSQSPLPPRKEIVRFLGCKNLGEVVPNRKEKGGGEAPDAFPV